MNRTINPQRLKPLSKQFAVILIYSLMSSISQAANPPEIMTGLSDQSSVTVTIYNNNLALIKDKRQVTLNKGIQYLAFREVSAQIQPETALLKSDKGSIKTVEQNFDFDLLSPQKLLDKYVGKSVGLRTINPKTGESTIEKATVLANNGGVILKIGNRIETNPTGQIIYDDIPANLRDRPTLVTTLNNQYAGKQSIELSYLTSGLSWKADYVAELNANDDEIALSGWVTLDNQSGTPYQNAQLQLVAGEVNRVTPLRPRYNNRAIKAEAVVADAAPMMQEESLMDYHLYTLENKTTIKQNQTKQVALLSAQHIPVTKSLELVGSGLYYYSKNNISDDKLKANVYLNINNDKASNLGIPLPKGIIRTYKKDQRDSIQFVGEDQIDHTAKNDKIRLKLGESFDVSARKKQTDFALKPATERNRKFYESAYEIELNNGSNKAVTVEVIEPIPGDWSMIEESHKGKKLNANQYGWSVKIPAEGKTKLTYRTLVKVYR